MISPEPWELSVEGDIIFDAAGFPVAIKPTFSGANGDMRLMACAPVLRDVLLAMVEEQVDYMTINNLGDPEKQHNIKRARALLAEIEGGGQ